MVGDPNARRDKALESIARSLDETNKLLARIEKNTRRVTFTNHPDPFDVPQQPQPGETGKDDEVPVMRELDPPSPYGLFPQPKHPYLKRSPTEDSNAIE